MDTSVPLADDEYLKYIGQIVYSVGYLEWLLLGDIASNKNIMPPTLNIESLSTKSTGQIAEILINIYPEDIEDTQLRDWLIMGGRHLSRIAKLRNNILHARPATNENGQQVLYRWTARPGEQFFIDQSQLNELNRLINGALVEVNNNRPSLYSKQTA